MNGGIAEEVGWSNRECTYEDDIKDIKVGKCVGNIYVGITVSIYDWNTKYKARNYTFENHQSQHECTWNYP